MTNSGPLPFPPTDDTSPVLDWTKKSYVWSFEAALRHGGNPPDVKFRAQATSSKDILDVSPLPKRQINNEGLTRYGNEFWSDSDIQSAPRRLPPRSGPYPPRQRNFFDFLYFRRYLDASPPIQLKARRWNFSLFSGRIPAHTVDVAPSRDDERIAIGPPTEEEVAAAIQYAINHAADSQTSQGQAAAGAQGSEVCTQGQPAS
ncbi:hypothetical protein M405DRAFT_832962 [Rhizopogon salebrosus TDB-379]|nr:hypothetical protein M405DRAFT_832962 [Rhizopogon salebrosus TDB-379]